MSLPRILSSTAAALTAAAIAAFVAAPARAQSFDSEPDQLVLKYTATAGAHAVSGFSHQLEWSVIALPGGSAKVMLRVPLDSFESDKPALDLDLRQALEAERFPMIEVEGIAQVGALPVRFSGTLRIHGVSQPFTALLSISRAGMQLTASSSFSIDLDAFGVARPSLEGIRHERKLDLDFSCRLSLHPQAVVSGGFVRPASNDSDK